MSSTSTFLALGTSSLSTTFFVENRNALNVTFNDFVLESGPGTPVGDVSGTMATALDSVDDGVNRTR